jgi:hypothetical protein
MEVITDLLSLCKDPEKDIVFIEATNLFSEVIKDIFIYFKQTWTRRILLCLWSCQTYFKRIKAQR